MYTLCIYSHKYNHKYTHMHQFDAGTVLVLSPIRFNRPLTLIIHMHPFDAGRPFLCCHVCGDCANPDLDILSVCAESVGADPKMLEGSPIRHSAGKKDLYLDVYAYIGRNIGMHVHYTYVYIYTS